MSPLRRGPDGCRNSSWYTGQDPIKAGKGGEAPCRGVCRSWECEASGTTSGLWLLPSLLASVFTCCAGDQRIQTKIPDPPIFSESFIMKHFSIFKNDYMIILWLTLPPSEKPATDYRQVPTFTLSSHAEFCTFWVSFSTSATPSPNRFRVFLLRTRLMRHCYL